MVNNANPPSARLRSVPWHGEEAKKIQATVAKFPDERINWQIQSFVNQSACFNDWRPKR
jgi:hypothetical protein